MCVPSEPFSPRQKPRADLFSRFVTLRPRSSSPQDKTLDLLKENWDDFSTQLKTGDELIAKLEQEERDLKSLEEEVDGPVRSPRSG